MLHEKTRKMLLAAVVVLVIVAAAYYWYCHKYTVKVLISGLSIIPDGALTFMGGTTSTSDPASWIGKKITIHTTSMGKMTSTVASANATGGLGRNTLTVTTAAGANAGKTATYTPVDGDYARIMLR